VSDVSPSQFAVRVLDGLGIPPTPGNVKAMVGWTKAEGGHWHNDARYNPLNTTEPMPGAGNTGSQGNIKVYRDWQQGVEATVKTLKNGRYGPILRALRSGSADRVARAIGQTPWGTNGALVERTIASTAAGDVPATSSRSSPGAPTADRGGESAPAAAAATVSPAEKLGALLPMLQGRQNPAEALMGLAELQASAQPSVAQQILAAPSAASGPAAAPQRRARDDAERSLFTPGGAWGGTAGPVERISARMHQRGLQTSSGKRDRHGTASGGWSDHAKDKPNADARDWSGSVAEMDQAAVELAQDLGIKGYKKGTPLVQTVVIDGIRYQVLYRTHIGGDHFTHIHMGAMAQGGSK
jgi:hypothetical protein